MIFGSGGPIRVTALVLAGMFLTHPLPAWGEIDYRVKVDPIAKKVGITIQIPSRSGPVSVQIPNWMPGHYVMDRYAQYVHDFAATDIQGSPLASAHPNENTWSIPKATGIIKVSYWVPIGSYRRFAPPGDETFVQVAGAVHYMYVVGRKPERCRVSFDLPAGWPICTGLDPVRSKPKEFTAPTYDVLIDNPLSTGDVLVDHYKLRGKEITIALEGATKSEVDRARLLKYCEFVSASEAAFFGGVPYDRYVWHFIVTTERGGGGLEHLSSTQITFGSRLTAGTISLLAHEHFHLWNVKRIRPFALGPFDYNELPRTGALWWSEGVTDYYASLLPYRYGAFGKDDFLGSLARNYRQHKGTAARFEVSPYESSYRLNESPGAQGGSGANGGYRVSFYNLGWLCGFCLDTEIRSESHGRYSLDDVMLSLFERCKNSKPGFQENDIRSTCVRFGGPALGPFYDRIVMAPGELPIPEQLAKLGLKVAQESMPNSTIGLVTAPESDGAAIVKSVAGVVQQKLKIGDRIVSVDGLGMSASDRYILFDRLNDYASSGHAGPIALQVVRGSESLAISIERPNRTTSQWVVHDDPTASLTAVQLRKDWLRVSALPTP